MLHVIVGAIVISSSSVYSHVGGGRCDRCVSEVNGLMHGKRAFVQTLLDLIKLLFCLLVTQLS